MLAKTVSASLIGIDAFPVEIEVDVPANSGKTDSFVSIVGLPDAAVRESRDRVKSALQSSGFVHPAGAIVVNLAPADLRKEGAAFDLGIALGMIAASGGVNPATLARTAVLGELALDGTVRPVRGALPAAALFGKMPEVDTILVPPENGAEAALAAAGKPVYPVVNLRAAVECMNGAPGLPLRGDLADFLAAGHDGEPDFAEVKGQSQAKRALVIAAAGGHNLLMIGPPGTGKSMLAMRLPGILPPMTFDETLETSRIHSVLGLLADGRPLLNRRPFRAPHHTVSDMGLIGGGRDPRPGEISLAHNGVLFLDELPEFKRNVLEVLRQPLETGEITVSRAAGTCTFPARFMLCAAMNPCPCGRGDYELGCTCKLEEKRRYLKKLSGPLLDRIDLQVEVRQLSSEELLAAPAGESSAVLRARVIAARDRQLARFGRAKCRCNARMGSRELQEFCRLDAAGVALLRRAIASLKLSPRAYDRILKVARTVADLDNAPEITQTHLFEAISYRKPDFS